MVSSLHKPLPKLMTPVHNSIMSRNILLVGIGGFLGSILRYLITVFLADRTSSLFPFGTLAANLIGCLLIGIILAISERAQILTPEWRILLTTGFCGGLTTLSTFSYESIRLLQDGEVAFFSANLTLNVLVGFAATYLGLLLVRAL